MTNDDGILPATRVTQAFGIRYPILAGGMMWLSDPAFVAAMGRAGGLGFLTARSFAHAQAFAEGVSLARRLAGDAPIGVNFTLSRHSDNQGTGAMLELALAQGITAFETAGTLPPQALIDRIHEAGGILLHKCAALRHARAAQAAGVDMVGLVGMEEGGHPGPGELPTSLLGALAARELDIPLVVGGGIGCGEQIVAALALGADAVVMGTRFLACDEIWAHPAYKAALVAADENATVRVFGSLGRTWRVLRNRTAEQVADLEAAGERDYAAYSALVSGTLTRQACYTEGDVQQGLLSCGPAVGFIDRGESLAQTVQTLVHEARRALARVR
ncbi:nitronate monooxygenase [Achromobacter sp. GG226]|uniref:NAD(P)H-dependent flavin oxidoreductase n=1 Tax=Verticiella alkaliphila TaxID=2779529 RepID=UPI001C0CFB8D|nr:nitronate monooxygenase [Verticiella sp. GG226]MBU4611472.1 nitronate monooxygenase [Verticiella sp. GG226]